MQDIRIFEVSEAFAQAMEDRLFAQHYQRLKATQDLARIITRARKAQGLTQSELAAKIGSTQPSLSRLENGKVPDVGMEMIRRIGSALGLKVVVELR